MSYVFHKEKIKVNKNHKKSVKYEMIHVIIKKMKY